MGNSNKKWCAWNLVSSASSSSSTTLLLLMIPLIVISGFVSLLGPKSSNWVFMRNYPWLWASSESSSSSSSGTIVNGARTQNSLQNKNNIIFDFPGSPPTRGVNMGLMRSNLVVDVNKNIVNNVKEAISDDSVLNRSSSPPLAIEPVSQEANGTKKEKIRNNTWANNTTAHHEPQNVVVPLVKVKRQREYTNLERLEARLMKARSAISEAKVGNQTQDSEYTPVGPMYWNAKAFHRSYLEMEKEFKVFVYEEGEPPLFHNGPCKSIYSMEGNFIHEIEMNSHFRTRDPQRAHVYFLPFSVTMLVRYVYVRDSHDFGPIRHTVGDYVDVVSTKYPFWNRSLGADHFMLSCHDWGPETSNSVPYLNKNSIRVLCNANTSEGFNPSKDVSLPEINLLSGGTDGLLGGPSASRRPILAFFAGGLHGPIRPILLEHWEKKNDNDMKIQQYLPKGVSYYNMLRQSKYCICPSGYEVASPRIVEAIYTGCVPVLISDHYVPPFSDVLNWKSFSVEVPVTEIPNLKRILMSISPRQYIRMQRRVLKVRKHFEVNSPPKRFDVFHMILHSIWLRRLNIRVRDDQ